MRTAVYPGSFDPFTIGHLDVMKRACETFDLVYVALLNNSAKRPFFSKDERVGFIDAAMAKENVTNYKISSFDGLLVDFVKQVGAGFIVRGLRAVTDFEYEFQINAMNRKLAPDIDTVYFMAEPENLFLSSSIVKEVASYGGSIRGLVPDINEKTIAERLLQR